MEYIKKSIMIQGTGSSVGKSLITAGLCRIFKQDGFQVAPFKSQNMALNSFITKEGGEMGRAQVVQAEAAGIEPHVDMNPVLLKPTTDRKSQVIIKGRVYGNMSAMEYHKFKPELKKLVMESFNSLAEKNDIVVMEGAGSPAEINLRDSDIVNMGMAEMSDSPVIIVGDIDRGGVFASIAGTMLLLTEEEKKRVKGVIINKFRGDVEILKPGLVMLEDIIKVPVLGVVPYTRLNIEEEDSLSERLKNRRFSDKTVKVCVVRLKHISNFTDFNVFDTIEGVSLAFVNKKEELRDADIIIIPGSKSTIDDMLYLRESGMEAEIIRHYKKGGYVFGICGGMQMLGQTVKDPYLTESERPEVPCIGLLEISTEIEKEKVTTQAQATINENYAFYDGLTTTKVQGYEIHMGNTRITGDCREFLCLKGDTSDGDRVVGVINKDGRVMATYLHGIFDNLDFTLSIINKLREEKGVGKITSVEEYKAVKEKEYDKLAEVLKSSLDIDKIYRIIEESSQRVDK